MRHDAVTEEPTAENPSTPAVPQNAPCGTVDPGGVDPGEGVSLSELAQRFAEHARSDAHSDGLGPFLGDMAVAMASAAEAAFAGAAPALDAASRAPMESVITSAPPLAAIMGAAKGEGLPSWAFVPSPALAAAMTFVPPSGHPSSPALTAATSESTTTDVKAAESVPAASLDPRSDSDDALFGRDDPTVTTRPSKRRRKLAVAIGGALALAVIGLAGARTLRPAPHAASLGTRSPADTAILANLANATAVATATQEPEPTPPPPVAAPAPAPPSAAPVATKAGFVISVAQKGTGAGNFGRLTLRGEARSKPIYMDGKLLLGTGSTRSYLVYCGMHTISVAARTGGVKVDIPCGGEMTVAK